MTNRLRKDALEESAPTGSLDELPDGDDAVDGEGTERDQAVAMLRSALSRLRGDQRALVSLRYLDGFELWELAEIFGVPEGTVKSRLHHSRKQLKEILERMQR